MLRAEAGIWDGWVWPVAITDGREPVITNGFKPWRGGDRNTDHLGVDVAFRKRAGDPVGVIKHDATKLFISPRGTRILAAGPGKVWSAGYTPRGWFVLVDHGEVPGVGGVTTFYQHLESLERSWSRGDAVEPGDVLGVMGYSPGYDGEGWRHLHFELNFPTAGTDANTWPVDPMPYMNLWRKVAGRSRNTLVTLAVLALLFGGALLFTRSVG